MGLAMGQASKRQGSDNINTATQQRNDFLNELNSQINNLTKGYGNDVLTAQTNYGLSNIQATNEALSSKLTADLDIWKQKDAQVFERQLQQAGFTQEELMLDKKFRNDVEMFGYTSALQIKLQQISEAGANGRASMSNNLAQQQFAWDKERYGLERNDSKEAQANALMTQILAGSDKYNPNAKWGIFSGVNSPSGQAMGINKKLWELGGLDQAKQDYLTQTLYTSDTLKILESIFGKGLNTK